MVSRRVTLGVGLLAVVLLLLGVAFTTLSFQAMESRTAADASVGTAQSNDATAPLDRPLQLVVLGEGPVADRLGPALESRLSSRVVDVELADEPAAAYPGPVLVVGVNESLAYNPVTPRARVTLEFGFVGSGNGTLASQFATGDQPMVLTNRDPYVVQGDVTLRDESRGVVSLPAYRAHVTDRLAEKLSTSLLDAPGMDVGS